MQNFLKYFPPHSYDLIAQNSENCLRKHFVIRIFMKKCLTKEHNGPYKE
jgi:hypothetical protein